jgi:hypothetical protein
VGVIIPAFRLSACVSQAALRDVVDRSGRSTSVSGAAKE